MLLRRITTHVKDQNWTAIAIDFVIVVAGILIAFQVTEWNDERETAERERAATAALLEESRAALTYLHDMVADHDRYMARQEASIQALIAGVMPPDMTHEDFLDGITVTRRFVAPTPPRAVYDSLMATGDMRLIRDTEVIRRLAQYFATLDAAQEYSRRINDAIYATVGGYHPAIISIYDPDTPGRRRQDADFATLAADPQFLEDSVDVLRAMWAVQGARRNLVAEAERAFEGLCRAAQVSCRKFESLGALSPDYEVKD